jgi:hypothetical protein
VHGLDEFWHQKYGEDSEGRPIRKEGADQNLARLEEEGYHPPAPIHLPNPSYFPVLAAAGFPLIGYGILTHQSIAGKALIALGVLTTLSALIGWGSEPLEEEHHLESEPAG